MLVTALSCIYAEKEKMLREEEDILCYFYTLKVSIQILFAVDTVVWYFFSSRLLFITFSGPLSRRTWNDKIVHLQDGFLSISITRKTKQLLTDWRLHKYVQESQTASLWRELLPFTIVLKQQQFMILPKLLFRSFQHIVSAQNLIIGQHSDENFNVSGTGLQNKYTFSKFLCSHTWFMTAAIMFLLWTVRLLLPSDTVMTTNLDGLVWIQIRPF